MTALDGLLGAAGLDIASFEERLALAISMWQTVADIAFVRAESAAAADIVIGAQIVPRGIAYTNIHHESVTGSEFARLGQAAICLNPGVAWRAGGKANGESAVYELGRVLVHELGHAVGLDHPGSRGEVMAFSYQEDVDRLTEGDIAGIVLLYGAPSSLPAALARSSVSRR
jgi:ssRNA-specific RNase YbeY (16S rRNA maturation enzyme)